MMRERPPQVGESKYAGIKTHLARLLATTGPRQALRRDVPPRQLDARRGEDLRRSVPVRLAETYGGRERARKELTTLTLQNTQPRLEVFIPTRAV